MATTRGTRRSPNFGATMRRLREDRQWTLRTLGRRTGYDFSFLSRIENGTRGASIEIAEACDTALEAGGKLIEVWLAQSQVPRLAQLPAPPQRLAGRADQLRELTQVLDSRRSDAPVVIAIDGPAGAGKTALALRWAHEMSPRFVHGHLFVDLGGFTDASQQAADPSEVLGWFCTSLGATAIPATVDQRAALYRSLLAPRRLLVVLDNAVSSSHVKHLLPGPGQSAAIVTSRHVLSGLTLDADAHRVPAGLLSEDDAVALLIDLLGTDRADGEHAAVRELARLCGYLPLALRIAAERIRARRQPSPSAFIAGLSAGGRLLDQLEIGDSPGIRSVLTWSYNHLSAGAARLFRLLGATGLGTSIPAAAAVAGVDIATARNYLRDLDRLHLVELGPDDTIDMHVLVRAFAQERSRAEGDAA